jgi:hypothetical protein
VAVGVPERLSSSPSCTGRRQLVTVGDLATFCFVFRCVFQQHNSMRYLYSTMNFIPTSIPIGMEILK